jgi:RNA polymerase sigma factor (sigma-70 family)
MGKLDKYSKDKTILIKDFQDQEEDAIRYIYNQFYPLVLDHVLRYGGSAEDAQDVFQETIIALYKHIQKSDNYLITTDLKGYFFGIARNLFSAQKRYSEKLQRNIIEQTNEIADNLDNSEFDEELEEIFLRCFSLLDPLDQRILTMFYEGKTYKEIANTLKLRSDAYARRRKYSAKQSLIEKLLIDPDYRKLKGLI